jgi:hypothetical protein
MLTIQLHPEAAEVERQYAEHVRELTAWRDAEIEKIVRKLVKDAGK